MEFNKIQKAWRWMRSHKKLVIFAITVILIAILASCLGGSQGNSQGGTWALHGRCKRLLDNRTLFRHFAE